MGGASHRVAFMSQEAPWVMAQAPAAGVLPCEAPAAPDPSLPPPSHPPLSVLSLPPPVFSPLPSLHPLLVQNWSRMATCTPGSSGTLASP